MCSFTMKKLFVFILLLAVIVSISGVCATIFLKPFLKEKILDAAERSFGEGIELSGFDIGLLRGVIFLKGFKIIDSKLIGYYNTVTADEIILDIDLPFSLLQRDLVFQKIYLKDFVFNLKNKKRTTPLIKATSQALKGPEAEITPPKTRRASAALYIDRLVIENSKFIFADYSVTPSPTVTKIINIDGSIEDLSMPLLGGGALRGTAHLRGRFGSGDEGLFKVDGSFAKSRDGIDFDFGLNLDSVNLIRFSPYYSKTSFTILKEAKLDLRSEAGCLKNRINASQNARIYDIELYDIKPEGEDTLFGLPIKTVIEFFKDLKGDIRFSFNIAGTIDDPKFDPGPVVQQVLSNAMRDKIITVLQELPREVVKMSEKAINENLGIKEKLGAIDGDIEEKIRDLKKELKKIIEYKP